ncbi:MAG: hypothetical protein AB2536_08040, partial [Candidatus Thiodiazotropha endolucinida]
FISKKWCLPKCFVLTLCYLNLYITQAIAPQRGTQGSYGPFRVAVTEEKENLYYQKRTVEFTYAAEVKLLN